METQPQINPLSIDSTPIIEMQDITVTFGNTIILNHINLRIFQGEYVGLIGRNGSGKSTLMKTILGLIHPVQGEVKVFGVPLSRDSYLKIGYVPQMRGFNHEFPALVRDVVKLGLEAQPQSVRRGKSKDYYEEKIQLALHKVKMERYLNRPIGHLSGGEQQKVLLAQALVREPTILLLDEPTSALDFVMVQDFLSLLVELNKTFGLTLLVIQHNLEILRPVCSRLLMLRRSILYDGSPDGEEVTQMIHNVFNY